MCQGDSAKLDKSGATTCQTGQTWVDPNSKRKEKYRVHKMIFYYFPLVNIKVF